MAGRQNQTSLQKKAAKPHDKVSRSIGETSPSTVNSQQKAHQDNESKTYSDQRSKKAEKLAAH